MKQFFLPLTEPIGPVWALMLIGTVWMLIRKQWKTVVWLALPTALLFVLGSTPLIETLVRGEEAQWRPEAGGRSVGGQRTERRNDGTTEGGASDAPTVRSPTLRRSVLRPAASVVVVLGAGERMSEHDAYGFAADDAFSRILTGIELVRSGRARDLVLGGSYPWPGRMELPGMLAVQNWVQAWGVTEAGGRSDGASEAGEKEAGTSEDGRRNDGRRNDGATETRETASSPAATSETSTTSENESADSSHLAAKVFDGGTPAEPAGSTPALPSCEVTNLGICLTTHDEAVAFKNLKQFKDWDSVILVTSALHMRRSKLLFEHMGIKVQPVAADFEVYGVSQDMPFSIFPRMHRLHLWSLYLHEKVGMVVYGRKGWI